MPPVAVGTVAIVGIRHQQLAMLVEVTIATPHEGVVDGALDHPHPLLPLPPPLPPPA